MVHTIENHFYTTSAAERDHAVEYLGYRDEGIACWVPPQPFGDETLPLYRLYNYAISDHFYTTSVAERDEAVRTGGYEYEGIACYVFVETNNMARIRPLHRLYHPDETDHFYTLSDHERDESVTTFGYIYEGTAGWVWPFAHTYGVPLYRLYQGVIEVPIGEPAPAAADA